MIIIIDYSGMSNLFRDFFQNNRIFLSWKPKSKNRKTSAAEISIYIQKQMSYGRFSCIIDKKTGFFSFRRLQSGFRKIIFPQHLKKTLLEAPDENMPLIPDDPVFRSAAALCAGLFGLQKKDLRRISDQRKPSVLFAEMFQHNPAGM